MQAELYVIKSNIMQQSLEQVLGDASMMKVGLN
jgi:hypothetical protein